MNVKIFYQNFKKNAGNFGDDLIFDPKKATYITEVVNVKIGGVEPINREQVANYCFAELNTNNRLLDGLQSVMKVAGHSSMSVGDYIEFEDGEVWIVKSIGWKVIPLIKIGDK